MSAPLRRIRTLRKGFGALARRQNQGTGGGHLIHKMVFALYKDPKKLPYLRLLQALYTAHDAFSEQTSPDVRTLAMFGGGMMALMLGLLFGARDFAVHAQVGHVPLMLCLLLITLVVYFGGAGVILIQGAVAGLIALGRAFRSSAEALADVAMLSPAAQVKLLAEHLDLLADSLECAAAPPPETLEDRPVLLLRPLSCRPAIQSAAP